MFHIAYEKQNATKGENKTLQKEKRKKQKPEMNLKQKNSPFSLTKTCPLKNSANSKTSSGELKSRYALAYF